MSAKYFSDYANGRRNNFDFLRFMFATFVMFSHSWAFVYNGSTIPAFHLLAYDPLLRLTNGQTAFGGGSVDGFFLISGFLVTQSWDRSKTWTNFAIKRCLRIFPGLIVCLLAIVFVVGPLAVQDRSAYFHNPHTYKYLALMLSKDIKSADIIPGVFAHNPEQYRIDGSLWTIRYELVSYVLVAIFGMIGLYKRPALMVSVVAVFWTLKAVYLFDIHSFGKFDDLFHLETYFFVGALFYIYRDKVRYSGWLALACVAGAIVMDLVHKLAVTEPLFLGYLIFYLAYNEKIQFHNFAKFGDFSYGLYLYACPIQQLLTLYLLPNLNAYSLFVYSFPITLLVAVISWKCVEEPFLRLKPRPAPQSAASIAELEHNHKVITPSSSADASPVAKIGVESPV